MKKYSLIVLSFAGIACALYAAWPRNLQQSLAGGVQTGVSGYADVDMDTLDNYNANYGPDGYGQRLAVASIKEFLANQILDFGRVTKQILEPNAFRYLVGDRWEARQVGQNSYELIIPSDIPSILDTYKMLFGQAYSPEYPYNINDLDKTLKQGEVNNERLDRYRVEIVKALVGLKQHTVLAMLRDIAQGTWVEAVASAAGQLNPLVYGMKALYDQLASMQSAEALQAEIDLYIVATHDINLIKARIQELKEQVDAQKASTFAQAYAWASQTIWRSGDTTPLERRLAWLQDYLNDNKGELEMYVKFKQKNKKPS